MNDIVAAPRGTVRGNIKHFLIGKKHLIGDNILEVGSRVVTDGAWWMSNRDLAPNAKWIGFDMEHGDGVDVVGDIEDSKFTSAAFDTIICSEVLEHVRRPWIAINEMHRLLQPNGQILITTLFSCHIHGYPDDYWRFTPHCMRHLLNDAGFVDILIETDGNYDMILDDHGSGKQVVPMFNHIFASARKP